jgi:cytochrome c oxidase assembly protein subunit 11
MALAIDRRTRTGLLAALLAVAMTGLGYASVPLYRLFCQVTGLGGTTQLAEGDAPGAMTSGKTITVRFDANHAPTLPWSFSPEKNTQSVQIGARSIAFFSAKNLASTPVKGTATFNVTPTQAGKYFNKIQCFCFTEQTLAPGKQVRMPVIFFVDPKIMDDPAARDISEITLSYTFYPVDAAKKRS